MHQKSIFYYHLVCFHVPIMSENRPFFLKFKLETNIQFNTTMLDTQESTVQTCTFDDLRQQWFAVHFCACVGFCCALILEGDNDFMN